MHLELFCEDDSLLFILGPLCMLSVFLCIAFLPLCMYTLYMHWWI
jgi:hypothetical protein